MTRMIRTPRRAAGHWLVALLAAAGAGLVSFAAPSFPGATEGMGHGHTAVQEDAAAPLSGAAAPVLGQGNPASDPAKHARAEQERATELASEYAAWKLEALTRSSGGVARESLRALRDRVRIAAEASPGEARYVDLLTSIEVRLIIAMMGAGDTEGVAKALAALEAGAAPAGASADGGPLRAGSPQAPGPVAKARRAALLMPEVRALLDRRATQASRLADSKGLTHSPADAAIDRAVREAVNRGADDFLRQLGQRATPSLRDLSLAIDGQLPPQGSVDALAVLMEIDPIQGFEVAASMAATRDILVKRRVAIALRAAQPLGAAGMWETGPGGANEPTSPNVAATLTGLLAEPGVAPSMLREVGLTLYQRGWIPKSLEAVMPAILGPDIDGAAPHVKSAEMLKTALQDPDPKVRSASIRGLRRIGELRATFAAATDPSGEVRHEVAQSLGPCTTYRRLGPLADPIDRTRVLPTVDPDYESALLAIFEADSTDLACEEALKAALGVITANPATPVSQETLIQIASSARSPQIVGAAMAYASRLDGERVQSAAMAALSGLKSAPRGTAGQAVRSLLASLRSAPRPSVFWESLAQAQSAGLITNDIAPEVLIEIRHAAFDHPHRMGEALAWLTERADPDLWHAFYFATSVPPQVPPYIQTFTVGFGSRFLEPYMQAFGRLPEADMDELMPMTARRLSGAMAERMLEDRTMTPKARVWLVKTLISRGQHEVSDPARTATAILDAYAGAGEVVGSEGNLASNGISSALFLEAALARADLQEDVLLDLHLDVESPPLIDAVLERFPPSTWTQFGKRPLLKGAISGIMRSDRPDRIELMKALVRADEQLAITVVEEIRCKGRPQDFELLEVVFEYVRPESEAWKVALDAATNYLNDDAAGLLLELARRPYDLKSTREDIMAAVRIIQDWQAAQRRFAEGLGIAAARTTAVKALVEILEASESTVEARAEALKGLGRLGAEEELPRLIHALSNPEEAIQEAARRGLEIIEETERR